MGTQLASNCRRALFPMRSGKGTQAHAQEKASVLWVTSFAVYKGSFFGAH